MIYFYLSVDGVSLLYPIVFSLFLFFVYVVFDWIRYYLFNKSLLMNLDGDVIHIQPQNHEQLLMYNLLHKNKTIYSKKYQQLKESHNDNLYFLSHFMHYLKTPVSVIALITSEQKKSTHMSFLEKIERENKRLSTSINQALAMVRMNAFENDLDIRAVDLLSSLRKIVNEHKKECIHYEIYPTIECEQEPVWIVTDSKWNELLLQQIISNAIKYSALKQGKKKLLLKIVCNPTSVQLSVIDAGIGIPPYDMPSIFQPFFTGENGRKTANSSGIGLYICKRIADQLGHPISIQSVLNIGTTVTIQWIAANEY